MEMGTRMGIRSRRGCGQPATGTVTAALGATVLPAVTDGLGEGSARRWSTKRPWQQALGAALACH